MLAKITGNPYNQPITIIYCPIGSDVVSDITKGIFLLIRIAALLALEPNLEW